MDDLVNKIDNLTLSDIANKIHGTDDIDELNCLVENLHISTKFNQEEKCKIFYWVFCQSDTINRKLLEKEKLSVGCVF